MTDSEIIEVVTAHKEGKKIQFSFNGYPNQWYDAIEPEWNFQIRSYRVTSESRKPREWWIEAKAVHGGDENIFDYKPDNSDGMVRVREVLENE